MSENQFDASNVAIRTLQTPLGVKNFQPMGNGLWTVMDASDGADQKAIEAPDEASDKRLIHALMKAALVW
ncbi:MAG: hypothetical protein JNK95_04975 [Candidatus Competibacter sp.]|nr:hypothetical protein [Candidatus Competibacter sp.]MDG4606467.1 hypothetical protein [Candidatus Contendobacter sp.]MDS4059281.1 hypothetical protein [Candidatus Contendobacter sp.]